MLAQQLGNMIKDFRVRKRLSQTQLAQSANVSRTVLSRLEQARGAAVQTDTLDRLLRALGVTPQVIEGPIPDAARRLAREEQLRTTESRRTRHLRLAIKLAAESPDASSLVPRARERVELWRRAGTCSRYYIERWAEVLELPPRAMAVAMASFGDWEDAMFQNSPWPRTCS
jgi:transcriptional regulator with XRE-family HTH domain